MGQGDDQETTGLLASCDFLWSFTQFSCSGRVWVWRSSDQEFWMNRLQPTVKHGGFSVMVWDVIWHDGKSELVMCEGRINSAKYIEILKEGLLSIFLPALMLTRTTIFSWKMVPPVIHQK